MNPEAVQKEYADELAKMQMNGMIKVLEEERRYKKEMEEMEEAHQNEMYRLRGEEWKANYEKREYDRKREEEARKHEREMKEIERKKKKEEEKLRDDNFKLWKVNLLQSSKQAREVDGLQSEMANQGFRMQAVHDNEENVKKWGKVLLETSRKWSEVKENYQFYLENSMECASIEDKSEVLKQIEKLVEKKHDLNQHLIRVKGLLGSCKPVATEESFLEVESDLKQIMDQRFEDTILTDLKRQIKRNIQPEQISIDKINEEMDNYNKSLNKLLANQIILKTSLLELVSS